MLLVLVLETYTVFYVCAVFPLGQLVEWCDLHFDVCLLSLSSSYFYKQELPFLRALSSSCFYKQKLPFLAYLPTVAGSSFGLGQLL